MTAIKKRSVLVGGRKTSLTMEDEFWNCFESIARATGKSRGEILTELSKHHRNLSSAVRVSVLIYYVARAKLAMAEISSPSTETT